MPLNRADGLILGPTRISKANKLLDSLLGVRNISLQTYTASLQQEADSCRGRNHCKERANQGVPWSGILHFQPAELGCRLLTSRLNLWVAGRLTLNAEVVHGGSHLTIFVYSYVEVLMDQEVVPRSLADHLKIVYKRGLKAHFAIE